MPLDGLYGWTAVDGTLQPCPSIAGHLARGARVSAWCSQRDCQRKAHLDLQAWVERGCGRLLVDDVMRLFRCNRLDGCGLNWSKPRSDLPLYALAGRSHVKLGIKCGGCGLARAVTVESIGLKLKAEGTGDESTMVADLPGLIKPCRTCRKRAWSVRILWPDPNRPTQGELAGVPWRG